MTRPMYESAADRSNEQQVIERLAAAWGGEYHKLPISYRMDYAVVRNGEIASFVEIKARHMRWGQYPTVMISMNKVLTAANYAESLGLPTMFVVCTSDGRLHFARLGDIRLHAKLVHGGRTVQTRDGGDIEPCYMIPNAQFAEIK